MQNSLDTALPYGNIVPMAVLPSILAFSRLISASLLSANVISSIDFINLVFMLRILVRSARYKIYASLVFACPVSIKTLTTASWISSTEGVVS